MHIKILVALIFVLSFLGLRSQTDTLLYEQQHALLEELNDYYNEPKTQLSKTDEVLASGKITRDIYISGLYSLKAQVLERVHEDEIAAFEEEDLSTQKIIQEIMDWHNKAVQACDECSLLHILRRYEFEKDLDGFKDLTAADLKTLKANGYKPDIDAPALGFSYSHSDKADLIGIEFSPLSFMAPRYKLKKINKQTGEKEVVDEFTTPAHIQLFVTGANKNISRQGYEVWFSLGQLTSPFMINPAKIGFTENYVSGQKPLWFYRPELGFGWSAFSINCGYNFLFKKAYREESNKWYITARINYPLYNYFKK